MSAGLFFGDRVVEHGDHPLVSLIGRRVEQQDAALRTRWVCAVADGMGGHADGAAAAKAALEVLATVADGPLGKDALVAAVADADLKVKALSDGGWRAPGTTLVVVAADPSGEMVNLAWVGDSRAYVISADGEIEHATLDHAGDAGGLTRCLGDHGDDISAMPDTFSVRAGFGAKILLCSDGVSGPIDWADDDAELVELLAEGLEVLVETAAGNGSDNATAVLVDVDVLAAAAAG